MRKLLSIMPLLTFLLLVACTSDTVFFHYEPAQLNGWEKNDSVIFDVPQLKEAGTYSVELGMRTTSAFPFTSVCIIVDKNVYSKNAAGKFYRSALESDTVSLRITESDGTVDGSGLSRYQYILPLNLTQKLSEGDSLHFTVHHNMKRSILPGISDIGIKLQRNS